MRKKVLVTAIIDMEADNLDTSFVSKVLKRIAKYFLFRFKYDEKDCVVVKYEMLDSFIILED
tara:strand:+ start:3133 stop:3318 length:186 start_codon:yes stop_codon:yes gene_type:complete